MKRKGGRSSGGKSKEAIEREAGGQLLPLDEMEEQFLENLRAAAWVYETQDQFQGAIYACRAVIEHIKRRDRGTELHVPFRDIAEAFDALARGVRPTLFSKRSDKQKERSQSPERRRLQCRAAAMLEVIMKVGKETRQSAASRIARHVKHWRGMGTKIDGNTVIAWRKQFSRERDEEFNNIVRATLMQPDPVGTVNLFLKRLRQPRTVRKSRT